MPIAHDDRAIEAWFDAAPNREATGGYNDLKLEPIRAALKHLPPVPRPVTIAGTKGKGSTTRFLESILLAHGRSTVAFTSPHVRFLRERWRLDGVPASSAIIASACEQVAMAEVASGLGLTYFERCFAVACVLASDRPDAVFLCEVGIGGRLDCANSLDAALAIVTHLSFDHMKVLGFTLAEIADQKLGIARPDAPLLIAPQSDAGTAAIRSRLSADLHPTWIPRLPESDSWRPGLPGDHQRDNAATALAAGRIIVGTSFDEMKARQALAKTRLAARCQLVEHQGRRILIDGAHNPVSIAATVCVAEELLRPGFHLVIGIARDKDLPAVIDIIQRRLPDPLRCHRCAYAGHRARQRDEWPSPAWSWHERIAEVLTAIGPGPDLCITGSFYLAGETLTHLGISDPTPG